MPVYGVIGQKVARVEQGVTVARRARGTIIMKKLSLAMAAVLALLSIAGCAQYTGYYGKGKAPPPVVTKG
jgi:hypothetical protein